VIRDCKISGTYRACDQPGRLISPDHTSRTPQESQVNFAELFTSSRAVSFSPACGCSYRLLQICSWQAGQRALARAPRSRGRSNTGFMLGTMFDTRVHPLVNGTGTT